MSLKDDIESQLIANKDYTDKKSGISGDFGNYLTIGSDGKPYYDNEHPLTGDFGTVEVLNDSGVKETLQIISQAEFDTICSTGPLTIQTKTFQRNRLLRFISFGEDWLEPFIKADFCRNCIKLTEIPRLPGQVTRIEDNFLNNCSVFNIPIQFNDNIIHIGANFLANCISFNQEIILPPDLVELRPDFLTNCTIFNSKVTMPSHSTQVNVGGNFMNNCYSFNQDIVFPGNVRFLTELEKTCWNWQSFSKSITFNCPPPVTSFINYAICVDDSASIPYQLGVHICGLFNVEWKNLLPNNDTGPYRNLLSCDVPYNDWCTIEYLDGNTMKIAYMKTEAQFQQLFTPAGVPQYLQVSGGQILTDNMRTLTFGADFRQYRTKIDDYFCAGFTYLTAVREIPDSIVEIGAHFLQETGLIEQLIIPPNIKTIGGGFLAAAAKYNTDLIIPETVTDIGMGILQDAGNMTNPITWNSPYTMDIGDFYSLSMSLNTVPAYEFGIPICGTHGDEVRHNLENLNYSPHFRKLNSCKLNFSYATVKFRTDNQIGETYCKTMDEYDTLCNYLDTNVICLGQEIPRRNIIAVSQGLNYDLNYTKDNFCRNMPSLMEVEINPNINVISNSFCRDNPDLIKFISNIPSMANFLAIEDYFLANCEGFNQNLIIDYRISSIGPYFLYCCYNLTNLTVLDLPDNISVQDNVLSSNKADVPMIADGVRVCGNESATFRDLLPNRNSAPYRSLKPCDDPLPVDIYASVYFYLGVELRTYDLTTMNQFRTLNDDTGQVMTVNGPVDKNSIIQLDFGLKIINRSNWDIPDNFCQNFILLETVRFFPINAVTNIGKNFFRGCVKWSGTGFELNDKILNIGSNFLEGCIAFKTPYQIFKNTNVDLNSFMRECRNFIGPLTIDSYFNQLSDDSYCLSVSDNNSLAYITGIAIKGDSAGLLLDYLMDNDSAPNYRKLLDKNPQLSHLAELTEILPNGVVVNRTMSNETQLESLYFYTDPEAETIQTDNGTISAQDLVKIRLKSEWMGSGVIKQFLNNCPKLEYVSFYKEGIMNTTVEDFLTGCPKLDYVDFPNTRSDDGGMTSFGPNFLKDCVSFNRGINMTHIQFVSDNFMDGCSSYNKSLLISKELTGIGNRFLANCVNYNQDLNFLFAIDIEHLGHDFLYKCGKFNRDLDFSACIKVTDWGSKETRKSYTSSLLYLCESFNGTLKFPPNIKHIMNFLCGCKSFNKELDVPKTAELYNEQGDGFTGALIMYNCNAFTKELKWNCDIDPSKNSYDYIDAGVSPMISSTDQNSPIATTGFKVTGGHADIIFELPEASIVTSGPYKVFRHITNRP